MERLNIEVLAALTGRCHVALRSFLGARVAGGARRELRIRLDDFLCELVLNGLREIDTCKLPCPTR
jgi:hypothetical protein